MAIRIAILILLGCSMVLTEDEMRLPGDIRPTSYDIRLLPNFEEDDFKIAGHIEIIVNCVSNTNDIILNSADIIVNNSSIKVSYQHIQHLETV